MSALSLSRDDVRSVREFVAAHGHRLVRPRVNAFDCTVGLLPLVIAGSLWVVALQHVPLREMTDLGLISVLPAPYWIALVLVLGTAAVLVHQRRSGLIFGAYLVAFIMMVHGTPALLYGSLRYGWAWKHVGIVDYIVRHHSVDPTIGGPFAAYHSWPGFFALNALLVAGAGLGSALAYASWGPALFELSYVIPVLLIARALTGNERQARLAVLLFLVTNWVGQDYFSPQAFAYLLHLLVLLICLRYLPARDRTGRHRRHWRRLVAADVQRGAAVSPATRRALIGVVLVLMFTIVSSHQLTPFMLLAELVLLLLTRAIGPIWLALYLAVTTALWIVLLAEPFIGQNLYWIISSIGKPGENTQSTFVDLSHATTEQLLVVWAGRALTAGMFLLGAVGALRLRIAGRPHRTACLLATGPVLLLAANNYGGEMLFRTYLFALPFLAILVAGLVYGRRAAPSSAAARDAPGHSARAGPGTLVRGAVVAALVLALTTPFMLAYYGKERANYFSPDEVAASRWVYSNAPRGSVIVAANASLPWAYTHYEWYQYVFLEGEPAPQRAQLARRPVAVLNTALGRTDAPVYVILTAAEVTAANYAGNLPFHGIDALQTALDRSPTARAVFRSEDATVFRMTDRGRP